MHLVDNDIIWKIASCDLVTKVTEFLHSHCEGIYVLSSTQFVLNVSGKNAARGEERFGKDAHPRIGALIKSAKVINWELLDDEIEALTIVPRIDSGEAQLFAATHAHADSLVITGDKNSLRALASNAGCNSIAARLHGRVIVLEQLILAAIRLYGFQSVRDCMAGNLSCDRALEVAFGFDAQKNEDETIESLEGYISGLRGELVASGHDLLISDEALIPKAD